MLKISFKKYLLRLLFFSIFIAGLSLALLLFFPDYTSSVLPTIILFFFLIMLITHYILLRGIYKKGKNFVSNYMLATTIKFLAYIIFLLITLLIIAKEERILFIVTFLIIYLLFSIFEIYTVKREQKEC